MPLRLDEFEQLPKHARRCVYWELDPGVVGQQDYLADPEFEKEAWLSMVMLEWGSCGQIAMAGQPPRRVEWDRQVPDSSACLGYALYAPPGDVPRARQFPTGPVSADAVLLTTLGVECAEDPDGLARRLVAQVVADLVQRGVRALEAFGRTREADVFLDDPGYEPSLLPIVDTMGDCSFDRCVIDADFLQDAGFVVVAEHRYFPRLRLELDRGLGWKAGVEAALERLLESVELPQTVGAGAVAEHP